MPGNLSSHARLFLSRLCIGEDSIDIGIGIAEADNQIGVSNRSFVPWCSQRAYQHAAVMDQCPLCGLQLQHLKRGAKVRYGPTVSFLDGRPSSCCCAQSVAAGVPLEPDSARRTIERSRATGTTDRARPGPPPIWPSLSRQQAWRAPGKRSVRPRLAVQ